MIRFAVIHTGKGGAASCVRCQTPEAASHRGADEIASDIEHAVSAWPGGPGPNVALRGPELLDHPETGTLLEAIRASGVERVCLHTDGSPLSSPAACERLLGAGIHHVRLTLLAGSEGAHDALTGTSGRWASALYGLSTYVQVAAAQHELIMLCGRLPVCPHNLEELPGAVIAFAQAGVRSVALDVSRIKASDRTRPWVAAAIETGIVSGLWVSPIGPSAEEFVSQPEWALAPVSPFEMEPA